MAQGKRNRPVKKRRRRSANSANRELTPGEIIVQIFLAAMLGVFALFTFDEKYTKMDYSKYMFLLYAVCFAAFAFVCMALHTVLTRRRALLSGDGPLLSALTRLSVTDYAVIAFMLIGFVSSLSSRDPALSMFGGQSRYEGFLVMAMYGFIYFTISRWYTHRTYVLVVFAASAALVSLIGILQFYGFDWFGLTASAPQVAFAYGGMFVTTLGNVNVVSTFACFAIPMFAVLFIKSDSALRWFYLGVALLAWYLELIAHSDSGFVGLAAAFLLLLPFIITDLISLFRLLAFGSGVALVAFLYSTIAKEEVARYASGVSGAIFGLGLKLLIAAIVLLALAAAIWLLSKKFKPSRKLLQRIAAVVVIVCVLSVLLVGWFYPVKEDSGFLYQYTQVMRGNMEDTFGSWRGFAWRASLGIFDSLSGAQKLIGVGPGMFADHFTALYQQESVSLTGVLFDRAHNEYLQTLVTLGILGLLAYLAIMLAVLGRACKAHDNPVALALGAALLCFYAQAFFNFSVTIVTPFFWIFLGMLTSVAPPLPLKGMLKPKKK